MRSRVHNRLVASAAVISGAAVLLAWYVVSELAHPLWLPTIPSVVQAGSTMVNNGSLSALGVTGLTLVIGLAAMFVLSAMLALIMAASDVAEEALLPFVNAFLAVPHIALIPVFTFIWGFGDLTRIITVVAFALSTVVLTWETALRTPSPELTEMARAFGARGPARLLHVRMPIAISGLIAGTRLGVVQGIKGVISAEVLIGVVGIGKIITNASDTFNMAQLYAIVLIIILLSIGAYLMMAGVEAHMTRWNR